MDEKRAELERLYLGALDAHKWAVKARQTLVVLGVVAATLCGLAGVLHGLHGKFLASFIQFFCVCSTYPLCVTTRKNCKRKTKSGRNLRYTTTL